MGSRFDSVEGTAAPDLRQRDRGEGPGSCRRPANQGLLAVAGWGHPAPHADLSPAPATRVNCPQLSSWNGAWSTAPATRGERDAREVQGRRGQAPATPGATPPVTSLGDEARSGRHLRSKAYARAPMPTGELTPSVSLVKNHRGGRCWSSPLFEKHRVAGSAHPVPIRSSLAMRSIAGWRSMAEQDREPHVPQTQTTEN